MQPTAVQMDERTSTVRPRRSIRTLLRLTCLIVLLSIPLLMVILMRLSSTIVIFVAEDPDASPTDAPSAGRRWLPNFFNAQKPPNAPTDGKDESKPPLLLLISYDAFRWDYLLKMNNTPTFRWLIRNGVFATNGLLNTYITITAPNHYGIVTGLYEESHGIVANDFYGPEFNESFDYFDTRGDTDPRFFGGEPIWIANDNIGPGRATGCQMWVGCDVPIKGHMPLHYTSWDGDLAWKTRVDSLVSWYKHPTNPINLGLLYIEEPDETGHMYGPDSPHVVEMVEKLDELTAYLLWRLHTEDLLDKINIIFTADHGMASVPYANVVNLDEYVDPSTYTVYGGTPNWNVLPAPGKEQEIYDALYEKVPHLLVYNKTTIPNEFHYTNTPHVMPIQLVSDLHWRLAHNDTVTKRYEKTVRGKKLVRELNIVNTTVGEHGYNNSIADMHPYFISIGPAFKQGFNISQFMNIDIYPLMCHILGATPAPNNGSFDRVKSILRDDGNWTPGSYRTRSVFTSDPPAPPPHLTNMNYRTRTWKKVVAVSTYSTYDSVTICALYLFAVALILIAFILRRLRRQLVLTNATLHHLATPPEKTAVINFAA